MADYEAAALGSSGALKAYWVESGGTMRTEICA